MQEITFLDPSDHHVQQQGLQWHQLSGISTEIQFSPLRHNTTIRVCCQHMASNHHHQQQMQHHQQGVSRHQRSTTSSGAWSMCSSTNKS
eukprot:4676268-Amphidinium_carterae.1